MFWKKKIIRERETQEKQTISRKVLVVDDEDYYLNLISKVVESVGYEPIAIGHADKAISKIKNGLEYGLLVQDYSMYTKQLGAKYNHLGGEFLANTSKKVNPLTKIIVCSAWTYNAEANSNVDCVFGKIDNTCLQLNLDRYIKKYMNPSEE